MRHVRQINANDCGIAVAAMLAGRAYRTTMRAAGFTPHREEGLYVSEMIELLSRLTKQPWRNVDISERVRLSELWDDVRCAVVIGRRSGVEFGHWIALDRRTVYDPEMAMPMPMHLPQRFGQSVRDYGYPRRDWRVLRVVICGGP
jgi:hypothetical protein